MRACSPGICVLCYLSTVIVLAQLCYAFRRWNEIGLFRYSLWIRGWNVFLCVSTADLAKTLYQNATLENINLIQIFSARERKFDDIVGNWKRDIQASFAIVISCHYWGFADAHEKSGQGRGSIWWHTLVVVHRDSRGNWRCRRDLSSLCFALRLPLDKIETTGWDWSIDDPPTSNRGQIPGHCKWIDGPRHNI